MVQNDRGIFQGDRYITRGIREVINNRNPLICAMLFDLIDEMKVEKKDYLQVFNLQMKFDKNGFYQEIIHEQEEPEFKEIIRFYTNMPVDAKIYVIDNGAGFCTMILAEEY